MRAFVRVRPLNYIQLQVQIYTYLYIYIFILDAFSPPKVSIAIYAVIYDNKKIS